MKYQIVSVRDRAADCFAVPQFVASIGGWIRAFGDEINRKADNNQLAAHPEDFDGFHLGEYDDASAEFVLFERPRQIAIGKDLVRSE